MRDSVKFSNSVQNVLRKDIPKRYYLLQAKNTKQSVQISGYQANNHCSVRVKMTVERQKCKLKTLYCRTARILLFIIGVILTLFGISMAFLAPHLINAKIYQQKNIARNNELYHLWENPDYKFSSEIFVYSVKNPQQVLDGNKPEMIKIGPYAYEMSLKKKILGFGNGSVKYQNVHNFTFDKNASCAECSPTREIWIPNIVFQ
ncbi:unnamed protein product, partial [Brugia timori]|uniref:Scavenger receptor class B member 2 n=1 Tax=Brugia timori TaxID=42155 RepID=A0A0R3R3W2_9BILA